MKDQRSYRTAYGVRRVTCALSLACGLLLAVCTGPATPSPLIVSPGKKLLRWAQDLVQHLPLANTSYQHKPTIVTWAGVEGATAYTSHADCSGFLLALLAQSYRLTTADFTAWLGKPRPLAEDFYEAIVAQNGFMQIQYIDEVLPGDIIAIRYGPRKPDDTTGHVMLVAGKPQPHDTSPPLIGSTMQWDVPIIDSSKSGHGTTDTRYLGKDDTGKALFHEGAGQGVMRLYTDATGAIMGYTWSDFAGSRYYDQMKRPLGVGRLQIF